MNPTEFVRHVHSYTSDYTRFADTKAGFVLATAGVLFGVVAPRVSLLPMTWTSGPDVLRAVLLVIFVIADALAFYHAVGAVRATVMGSAHSLVAFPAVALLSPPNYAVLVSSISEDARVEQVSTHIIELGQIALRKYRQVNQALTALEVAAFYAASVVIAR